MRIVLTVASIALGVAACGGDSGDNNGPAPVATHLTFQVQPSLSEFGGPITPAIEVVVRDSSENAVTTAANPVTLSLSANPTAATLSGTATVNADDGVASFADLQISKPGTGYTLSATASGLASATSSAFDVVSPGVATRIDLLAGDGQTAMVGQAVAISPAVKATDGFGDPVGGVSVTFQEPGTPIGSGVIQTTDIGGVATLGEWRLGTAAGEQTLFALSGDLQGSPVTFTATAEPGPPVTLVLSSGEDQVASLGGLVVEPPAVLVTDNYGNPVAGVAVTFAVASGGGSISGESQVTGVDGIAAVGGWRVGDAPGANTLTATSAGLSGSPAIFHATARSFPTTISVEVHSDYFQSARNGSGNPPGTPAVDTIAVGGTVTWQWVDSGHNVTTVYGASGTQSVPFTFGPVLAPSPGSIVYRCTIHSRIVDFDIVGMWGVIVVR